MERLQRSTPSWVVCITYRYNGTQGNAVLHIDQGVPHLNVLKTRENGNENSNENAMERLQPHISCYVENYQTYDHGRNHWGRGIRTPQNLDGPPGFT